MILANYSVYELVFMVMLTYFGAFLDASLTVMIMLKESSFTTLDHAVQGEMNPLGKYVFRKFGIGKGYFILLFLSFSVLTVFAYLPLSIWHYAIIVGVYVAVVFHNYSVYVMAKRKEKEYQKTVQAFQYQNQQYQNQ